MSKSQFNLKLTYNDDEVKKNPSPVWDLDYNKTTITEVEVNDR